MTEAKPLILFLEKRVRQLEDVISTLERELDERREELEIYREMAKRLNPCPTCRGLGKIRIVTDLMDSEIVTCDKCKGSCIQA